jgi:hypothetical protein
MAIRVPIRLLVHYQTSARPLVQLTEGERHGTRLVGAGTRAIDLTGGALQLFDPATGAPLGESIPISRALVILYSLTKR